MLFTAVPRPPARIIPGAVHLPGFLSEEKQQKLVQQARQLAREAAGTPVAMRRPKVGRGQMDAWLLSLGWFWATNPYRMLQEVDGYPVPPIPENFQGIADAVMEQARAIDPLVGPNPRIETALVNFYPPGAGMGLHVDAEETSENAVVSLSFGQDTVFRIEGHDVLLMSGDAVVFGGPARRAKHGVLGAREGTSDLLDGRLNITIGRWTRDRVSSLDAVGGPTLRCMSEQKVAVVTGGSAGIGEATCRALAKDGWKVVVAARRYERCQQIAEEIGGVAVALDVVDQESVDKLAQLERVDLLVNNAGGAKELDYLRDADDADWQWMFETNVMGTMRLTRALYPQLKAAQGLVVNIGSVAGTDAYKGGSGYNAAKFGLRGMTRALRREEAENGIRVCEIDPGRVKTDFSLNRFNGDEERAARVYEGKHNLTAGDIAEAVRWVASLPAHVNVDTMSIMPVDQAER